VVLPALKISASEGHWSVKWWQTMLGEVYFAPGAGGQLSSSNATREDSTVSPMLSSWPPGMVSDGGGVIRPEPGKV
jgi:hypothetical protein